MASPYRTARARTALRRFSRSTLGKAIRQTARFFHGPGGRSRTSRSGVSVSRYAFEATDAIHDLFAALGPFGQILRGVFKRQRRRPSADDMLDAARELLESTGSTVLAPDEQISQPPLEPNLSTSRILEPPRPGEERGLSAEHRTAGSSNVYSFQYDFTSSTLYVRYKAPVLSSGGIKNVAGGGMRAAGRIHVAGAKRPDSPGPLYAYLDVPVRVFRRMIGKSSAGKAVWDELRIRGTIYGHQYRYQLLQGAVVPGEGGNLAVYVPRRATIKGFRSRATATVGTGRRGYIRSTLPERLVNRGEPNRGQPNRGR